jgi:tetratricopeptide (TPR) repeat protein
VLLRLGEVLSYGTIAEAEEIYREALQMAMLQGDGRAQAQCFFALGVLSRRRADLSGSKHALSEALRRFQVYGDLEGVEKSLEAMTYAYIQQGGLAAAKSSAKRAAKIASETGRLPNLGRATLSLGIAHLYGVEYARALESFQRARDIATDTGDDLAEAEALRYLSAVYGADGRLGTPGQAWAAGERAIEICAAVGHRTGLARAADGLGGAYLIQRDWLRALNCYVAALAIGLQHRKYLASARSLLARCGAGGDTSAQGPGPPQCRYRETFGGNHDLGDPDTRLLDIPCALQIPVRGTDSVIAWLDQLVAPLLPGS